MTSIMQFGRFALVLLAMATLPAQADDIERIELEWKPTTTLGELGAIDLTGSRKTTIRVVDFTDSRKHPNIIGKNVEDIDDDGDGVITITTQTKINNWLKQQVTTTMRQMGAKIDQNAGQTRLSAEIQRFHVTEGQTYKSDVALIFTLRNQAGVVLWEGLSSGSATRFGRSLSDENYSEVLSDAVLEAVHGLLSQPGFRSALAKAA